MSPATTSNSAGLPDRTARIALGLLVAPGNSEAAAIVRTFGAVEAFTRIVTGAHTSQPLTDAVHTSLHTTGVNLPSNLSEAATARFAEQLADRATRRADQLGARIVTAADEEWPQAIEDLHTLPQDNEPPLCLWLRGPARLNETLQRSVSIVGARAVTSYGQFVATELAYGLAERGWTIVSGGALGVDVTAHRAALAAGGATCAVLANGIDQMYPVSNTAVFERIAEEGLLITEWPPGTRPHKTRFLTRNRLIAAATLGTVLVEAGTRSSTRTALAHARRLRRTAMAVPGPITSAMSTGCHTELRQPDTVLITTVDDITDAINGPDTPTTTQQPAQPDLAIGPPHPHGSASRPNPTS